MPNVAIRTIGYEPVSLLNRHLHAELLPEMHLGYMHHEKTDRVPAKPDEPRDDLVDKRCKVQAVAIRAGKHYQYAEHLKQDHSNVLTTDLRLFETSLFAYLRNPYRSDGIQQEDHRKIAHPGGVARKPLNVVWSPRHQRNDDEDQAAQQKRDE